VTHAEPADAATTRAGGMNVVERAVAWASMPAAAGPVPHGAGLVLLVAVHNWLVLMWQALQVGRARKAHGVRYPTLYEAKEDSEFNRYQRAHQNSLEWNTGFLLFLLAGGLSCPLSSAAAGLVYNQGRVVYARGYYAGSPHKGLWGLYGLLYLIGTTCYTALRLLSGGGAVNSL
jgi:glutathione S-transferase